jgi:hypothetical protein
MNPETLKPTLERLLIQWMDQHKHISEQSADNVLNVLGRAEEFEEKFVAIRKHTAESLTLFANEWIEDIHAYIIKKNGVYHGKVVTKSL